MNKKSISNIKILVSKEREERLEKVFEFMAEGVSISDPNRLDIRGELSCGSRVSIDINVVIEGRVVLEDGVKIGANCILRDCTIGKETEINPFTLIENSVIGEKGFVGPFGRVRPNSKIGNRVQIGNFVEVKNANISSNCRINHLSFLGDADLAKDVTIGAGTIFCNHDGVKINRIIVEEGAYIGSGCELVAPLKVNQNATIASGSTITDDVVGGTLTIARARQTVVMDWKGNRAHKE